MLARQFFDFDRIRVRESRYPSRIISHAAPLLRLMRVEEDEIHQSRLDANTKVLQHRARLRNCLREGLRPRERWVHRRTRGTLPPTFVPSDSKILYRTEMDTGPQSCIHRS